MEAIDFIGKHETVHIFPLMHVISKIGKRETVKSFMQFVIVDMEANAFSFLKIDTQWNILNFNFKLSKYF
jgi:hypothetical protein